jgi:lysophospholipase L1-like esterase
MRPHVTHRAIADRVLLRIRPVLVVTAVLLATVTTTALSGVAASSVATDHPSARATTYYVSIGDSYAAGYQPIAAANDGADTNGFAYQLVSLASAKGEQLTLENFACDGATTATLLETRGCSLTAPGPDTVAYPHSTQAGAAEQFLSAHRGHIGLVTVSIGGNDLLACSAASIVISCAKAAAKSIAKNLTTLLSGLRHAAGASVPIVGLTYPDVFLGLYRLNSPSDRQLATLSLTEFRGIFNPALRASYLAIGAKFLDVTAATGAYTPLDQTRADPPYGRLPAAVADVCRLTYYCQGQDVHPTTAGYALIAKGVVSLLAS